jgi:hypothetical protein
MMVLVDYELILQPLRRSRRVGAEHPEATDVLKLIGREAPVLSILVLWAVERTLDLEERVV